MASWKHILFDLDGTLTDSKPGITKGVQHALSSFGIRESDPDRLEKYIGPPLLDSFMKIHGFSEEKAKQAITTYREYYTTKGILEHEIYKGVPEMLQTLRKAGKRLYIATSKPTPFAEKMLRENNLDTLFMGIFGSYLDGRRTAKEEVIGAVMEENSLSMNETVMVGDRSHDVEGAKKNGIQVIGVLYGYGSRKEFTESNADLIVENVDELIRILMM